MKQISSFLFIFTLFTISFADDYSFDFDEIESIAIKPYEYNGYIKVQTKYIDIKNGADLNTNYGEAFLNFKYFKEKYTLINELMVNYENVDNSDNHKYTINQLYLNYKQDKNHMFNIGKISSKWGKGYFFNPIAFIDRKKDPYNPENTKEGYELVSYKYNKVYNSNKLKNFTLDIVYLPTNHTQNGDFYNHTSNNIAIKSYFLFYDIDIDIAYLYSDTLEDKYGFDFSTNLLTNFEIHAEAVKINKELSSYLLGIKYLTSYDLTITSDYFYQSDTLDTSESFWDNRYLSTKLSLKEPFEILYFTPYYKHNLNINDNSYQHSLGATYKFINNINLDFFIGEHKGEINSEYGDKKAEKFGLVEIKWNF